MKNMKNIEIKIHNCSMNGQCLLSIRKDTDGSLPMLSLQMPIEIALWIKNNLEKATDHPDDYKTVDIRKIAEKM